MKSRELISLEQPDGPAGASEPGGGRRSCRPAARDDDIAVKSHKPEVTREISTGRGTGLDLWKTRVFHKSRPVPLPVEISVMSITPVRVELVPQMRLRADAP